MNYLHIAVRATLSVALWLVLSANSALAHGGHDHSGGSDTAPLWLRGAGSVVVLALAYILVRQRNPVLTGMEPGEREKPDDH